MKLTSGHLLQKGQDTKTGRLTVGRNVTWTSVENSSVWNSGSSSKCTISISVVYNCEVILSFTRDRPRRPDTCTKARGANISYNCR
jgi:hypothetical protein